MKNQTDLGTIYENNPNMVSRTIADETILVPIKKCASDLDSIYCLDEVATQIWELLDGKKPVEDIRDVIIEEFEVGQEEAETDLVEFLQQLENIGAVKAV